MKACHLALLLGVAVVWGEPNVDCDFKCGGTHTDPFGYYSFQVGCNASAACGGGGGGGAWRYGCHDARCSARCVLGQVLGSEVVQLGSEVVQRSVRQSATCIARRLSYHRDGGG